MNIRFKFRIILFLVIFIFANIQTLFHLTYPSGILVDIFCHTFPEVLMTMNILAAKI